MPNFVVYFYIIGRKNFESLTKSGADGILHTVKTIFKTLYGDAGKICNDIAALRQKEQQSGCYAVLPVCYIGRLFLL